MSSSLPPGSPLSVRSAPASLSAVSTPKDDFLNRALERFRGPIAGVVPCSEKAKVSEDRFVSVLGPMTRGMLEQSELRDIFSRHDFDRNGRISQQLTEVATKKVYDKVVEHQRAIKRRAQIQKGMQYLFEAFKGMRATVSSATRRASFSKKNSPVSEVCFDSIASGKHEDPAREGKTPSKYSVPSPTAQPTKLDISLPVPLPALDQEPELSLPTREEAKALRQQQRAERLERMNKQR